MADETQVESNEQQPAENQEAAPQTEVKQTDPYLERALALGFNPDYDGEDKIDAREFVLRAPLFEKIKKQGNKLKDQEKAITDLAKYLEKVEETTYKKALRDLQSERAKALEEGDNNRLVQAEAEIDNLKESRQQVQAPQIDAGAQRTMLDFVNRPENKWYHTDPDMRNFANATHQSLLIANPGMDMEDSLVETQKIVKRAFPERFKNPNRNQAPMVESTTHQPSGKKTYSFKDLNEDQKAVARRFERMGIVKMDDYIKSLAEMGELG